MNTVYAIYGLTGVLALGAIVLAIVNWILLATSSGKMSYLENEISKKAAEFDALRKEMQRFREEPPPQPPTGPGSHMQAIDDSPGIQIVRNVRQDFQPDPAMELHAEKPSAPQQPPPSPQPSAAQQSPPQPAVSPVVLSPAYTPPPPAQPEGDIMDVVDGSGGDSEAPKDSQSLTITLYSPARKDADFAGAWALFNEKLPGLAKPFVRLDFQRVLFLYEQELQYLQAMASAAAQAGGKVVFVNCESELRSVLFTYPELAACVAGPR